MAAYLLNALARLRSDRRGVTALEYGVIAFGIVVAIHTIVGTVGTTLTGVFNTINTAL
jgi:pilus assembly protein Flp/PilA